MDGHPTFIGWLLFSPPALRSRAIFLCQLAGSAPSTSATTQMKKVTSSEQKHGWLTPCCTWTHPESELKLLLVGCAIRAVDLIRDRHGYAGIAMAVWKINALGLFSATMETFISVKAYSTY